MGAVELARAVADPELVGGEQVQAPLVEAQQRALVVEHEHLVAREHVHGPQRAVVHAAGGHEAQAAVDLRGDALVALARAGAADEVHVPLVQAVQVGQAGAGDRPRQVHRRRRVGVRADEPARVRPARLGRGLERVDHVTAVGRQPRRVDVRAARLGVLAGDAAELDDGHRRAVGEHHGHLQQRPDRPAQVRLVVVDEGLRAVAALEQERVPAGDLPEPHLQPVHLGRDRDRRHALQQRPHPAQVLGIWPRRLLGRRPAQRVLEGRGQRRRQRGKLGERGHGHVDGPGHGVER